MELISLTVGAIAITGFFVLWLTQINVLNVRVKELWEAKIPEKLTVLQDRTDLIWDTLVRETLTAAFRERLSERHSTEKLSPRGWEVLKGELCDKLASVAPDIGSSNQKIAEYILKFHASEVEEIAKARQVNFNAILGALIIFVREQQISAEQSGKD